MTPLSWFAVTPWSRDLKKLIQIFLYFWYFEVLHILIENDNHKAFFYRILKIKLHVAF